MMRYLLLGLILPKLLHAQVPTASVDSVPPALQAQLEPLTKKPLKLTPIGLESIGGSPYLRVRLAKDKLEYNDAMRPLEYRAATVLSGQMLTPIRQLTQALQSDSTVGGLILEADIRHSNFEHEKTQHTPLEVQVPLRIARRFAAAEITSQALADSLGHPARWQSNRIGSYGPLTVGGTGRCIACQRALPEGTERMR
jgi:hypothetical protein